jgi:D-alanyl-D-alanine carboxypeptidase
MLLRWIGGKFARTTTIVLASVVAIAATIAMGPDNAEARKRYPLHFHAGKKRLKAQYVRHGGRRYVARPAAGDRSGNPRFSAIVVDVKAGKVLYDASPDGLRHPASVTKVMTLYLLFEQLQAGHIKLDSELPVSAHAAAQAPTKLGLRPGSTLRVDDAIKGIVNR